MDVDPDNSNLIVVGESENNKYYSYRDSGVAMMMNQYGKYLWIRSFREDSNTDWKGCH